MIAIVCMKWGTQFGADYVNVLYRAVTRHLSQSFRFYCYTDDASGLATGIIARPIPAMGLSPQRMRRGCWPKIGLFQPGLIEESIALFLDLDLVITGSLDDFVDHSRKMGGLHIIREWNPGLWNLLPLALRPDRGGQSSVVCWAPSEQHGIYESFIRDPEAAFAASQNDQQHITRQAVSRHYWPFRWTISFKRSCVWYFPLGLILRVRRPSAASRIVVFHGKPRPHQLVETGRTRWGTRSRRGFGPVAWVQAYWAASTGPNHSAGAITPPIAPPVLDRTECSVAV